MAPFWAESRIFSGKAPGCEWELDPKAYRNRSLKDTYEAKTIHKDIHNDTDIELFLDRIAVESARMKHQIFLDLGGSEEKAEQLRKYYIVEVHPRDVTIESDTDDGRYLVIDYDTLVKPRERKMEWALEELAALSE